MPLLTKVGSFTKIGATGTQSITGVGFTPKAIIFWTTGSASASGTWQSHVFSTLGFTTGPTNSFAVAATSEDAIATSNTGRRMAAKAITNSNTGGSAAEYEADLASFDADGFTLNWTLNAPRNPVINYLALGGSDITGAKVVNWTTPTAVGNKAVIGAGFSPDLVLHTSAGDLTALGSAVQAYTNLGIMNKHGQQWANGAAMEDARSPANTGRGQQTDACIAIANTDGTAFQQQAHFVSMDADGFTTNFSNIASVASQVISLCLKGVSSKIGAFAKTTAAAPAAQSITRTGFTPKAVLFSDQRFAASGIPQINAFWGVGAYDGISQRSATSIDADAVNPTLVDSIFYSDAVIGPGGHSNSVPITTTKGAAASLDTDGFSLSFNPNEAVDTEILYLAIGDAGTNTFPTNIFAGGSTNAQATAFSNQRKLDRCQNGNLVALWSYSAGNGDLRVSTNNGLTWTIATPEIAGFSNGSMFIDLDDYLHVVWRQSGTGGARTNGFSYYMRGTPNAARTSWTWSTAVAVADNVTDDFPDLIAHREGTGWVAHIIYSRATTTPSNQVVYNRVTITSAGAVTASGAVFIGSNYGVNVHTFPSIDFNHIGDGKTVAGNTPHLYAAWSAGATGAGKGIRFRKATYSAGAWTWNPEREIDSRYYVVGIPFFINCLFDGTRVMLPGILGDNATNEWMVLHERDAADTTTALRLLTNPNNAPEGVHGGSATYDASGNVYLIGRGEGGTYLNVYKWTRSTNALTRSDAGPTGSITEPTVSAKRSYSHNRIEWVYTSGNNSPYAVKYDRIVESLGYYVPQIML